MGLVLLILLCLLLFGGGAGVTAGAAVLIVGEEGLAAVVEVLIAVGEAVLAGERPGIEVRGDLMIGDAEDDPAAGGDHQRERSKVPAHASKVTNALALVEDRRRSVR